MGYLDNSTPLRDRKVAQWGKARVSTAHQITNFTGCVVAGCAYFYFLLYSSMPLTLDIILTVFLAECCRWSNDRRRKRAVQQFENSSPSLIEKAESRQQSLDCVAAVVGFREDPTIFEQALGSYARAQGCRFLLVSIDGDQKEDQEMIVVFKKVFPEKSALIHFDKPFAEIALQMDRERKRWTSDEYIIGRCCSIARKALEDSKIRLTGEEAITRLCITQPHMHKKGIMFTSFIVSLVVADMLGLEYVWSSDSDSMVMPDTLARTMSTFAGDPNIGGASTALYIHNKDDSTATRLGSAVYLNELYLARSFFGSVAANDCQSGPCAAFRLTAIQEELLAWYKQSIFGHWMIINEDRHLTTRLLVKGWRVVFVCDVLTATESPTTLRRWLIQQVRWARAVHIESFHMPRIYIMQSPVLFFGALKRQSAAFIFPVTIILYLYSGTLVFQAFSFWDYFRRLLLTFTYLFFRNPYRPGIGEWLWSVPANIFYNFTLPAIVFWSLVTALDDSWGTTMRSRKEIARSSKLRSRTWEVGFFVVWIGILGGIAGRYCATALFPDTLNVGACMFIGIVPLWAISACWMILAE